MKTNIVSTALSDEEYAKFMEAMLEVENRNGGQRITVSKFLRDTIMECLDEQSKSSTSESVSTPAGHTISEQKNKDALWNNIDVD